MSNNLESEAIQYGAPLVVELFQHIFDAIWNHAHPSTTPVQATATAANATAKVVQSLNPSTTLTTATVANMVNQAVAAGTINAPGSTIAPGAAINSKEITTQVSDSLQLEDTVK